jgi:hypothetical protein
MLDPNAPVTHSAVPVGSNEVSGSIPPTSLEAIRFLPARWLPPDQEYYWTEEWQAGERETRAELGAGHGMRFESAEDAIRWLLSDDDD